MVTDHIRRYFDPETHKWYFSVVDVIGALTTSTDPQNYWKVLKNRLKKRQNELVTKCNQLKMRAKDGKYYLTDTADSETIIGIIESIPKASVEAFKLLIRDIEEGLKISPIIIPVKGPDPSLASPLPETPYTYIDAEAELLVDAYETSTSIFIQAMLAGVEPGDINVAVNSKKVYISGKRIKERKKEGVKNYLHEELYWTSFAREISLPSPVETDNIKKLEENGLLTIVLTKIVRE